jgi:phosphonoacetate hydrolase
MTARRTERILLFFWDGMRPDHIRAELTPNLHALATGGTWYREARDAWPSISDPNITTLATGAYPGRHGIHNGYLTGLPGDRTRIMPNVKASIERLRAVNGGRVLPVRTLVEALVDAGRRVVTLGSGPAGHGNMLDPEQVAVAIHTTFGYPDPVVAAVRERFGDPPDKAIGDTATDDWVTDVLLGHVLPELEPDVALVYSVEPDLVQHACDVASPPALAAIRAHDARLGRVLEAVAADAVPTTVIVMSDHGFCSIRESVELRDGLREAGFGDAIDSGRLVCGPLGNEIAVEDGPGARDLSLRAGEWLARQRWAGGVFAPDDLAAELDGVLPLRRAWNERDSGAVTGPTLLWSFAWTAERNAHGSAGVVDAGTIDLGHMKRLPGVLQLPKLAATHGSLSPHDLNCTLVLAGAGIRASGAIGLPGGVVDVAPTILELLGLPPLPDADGRALDEALTGGPAPAEVAVRREELAALRSGPLAREWVGETAYLDTRVRGSGGA